MLLPPLKFPYRLRHPIDGLLVRIVKDVRVNPAGNGRRAVPQRLADVEHGHADLAGDGGERVAEFVQMNSLQSMSVNERKRSMIRV